MKSQQCFLFCEDTPLKNDLQALIQKVANEWECQLKSLDAIFKIDWQTPILKLFFISVARLNQKSESVTEILNYISQYKHYLFIIYDDFSPANLNQLDSRQVFGFLPTHCQPAQLEITFRNACQFLKNQMQLEWLKQAIDSQTTELQELNKIGIALSAERDMQRLLNLILQKAREITLADAGTLYLVEKKDNIGFKANNVYDDKQLRFKLTHCDSKNFNFTEFTMPIEKKSVTGYVTLTQQVLNIPDIYSLSPEGEICHNRSFDENVGYRTKSMLVIPMKNHKDEIIGVLQLINRKKNWQTRLETPEMVAQEVIPFDNHCVELATSLASQAAVAIENNRLYAEIKSLFDGFVLAAVHAIEQRDPSTSGHSERVARYTLNLAWAVNRIQTGPYAQQFFTENDLQQIRYAGLLHDFGKIGVRENVLVKAKKLYPTELEAVIRRFRLIKNIKSLKSANRKIKHLLESPRNEHLSALEKIEQQLKQELLELDSFLKLIIESNEPTVLEKKQAEQLHQIRKETFRDNGTQESYLTDHEVACLSIPRGSLSTIERMEIESHVTHTYNFLKRIPWTSELKTVPEIAYRHHEKLDGSGYPQKLLAEEIPIQARMMIIADIYDALTAGDRPYKKAVPTEKALDILKYEQKAGKIDAELLRIFIEEKIYAGGTSQRSQQGVS